MNVMVIGGYGQVGSLVVERLLEYDVDQIVIAGRSMEKAERMRKQIQTGKTKVAARKVDVETDVNDSLKDIDVVVMCLENNNRQVLRACIKEKVDYVDITPSTTIIEQLQKESKKCKEAGIRAVLGVGIAPGMSNLMAKKLGEEFQQIESVDTFLMLGVGENHGTNAVRWLVNNINHAYKTDGEKGMEQVRSFTDKRIQVFENGKRHMFTRIDLADSTINRQCIEGAKCNSWFAYDVNIFTKLVWGMQKCGMFIPLRFGKMKRFYQGVFNLSMKTAKWLHIGSDQYRVIVKVSGICQGKQQSKQLAIQGHCNNQITAQVAADAVVKYESAPAGITYLRDITDAK